jgi:hypothetical protein
MDIFIIRDSFRIVDLTRIDMVQRISTTYATMVAQEKTRSYTERTLGDASFTLLLKCMGVFILVLIHS